MTTSLWRDTIFSGILAAILNGIIFFVGQLYGVTYAVSFSGADRIEVVLPAVLIVSFLAALLGGVLLWFLGRMRHGDRIFMWIALIITLASFVPLYLTALTLPTMILLGLMHAITALIVVWWLVVRNPLVFNRPKEGARPISTL